MYFPSVRSLMNRVPRAGKPGRQLMRTNPPVFRPRLEAFEDRVLPSTVFWTGAVNRLWSVVGNWSTGAVPGPGDKVVFNKQTAVTQVSIVDTSFTVGPVSMDWDGTLIDPSSLSVIGDWVQKRGTTTVSGGTLTISGDCTNEDLLAWDHSACKVIGHYTGTKTSKQTANACTIDIGQGMVMDGLCNGQDDDCHVGGDCNVGDSGTVKLVASRATVDGGCNNAGELDWDHSSFKCTGGYTGTKTSKQTANACTIDIGKDMVMDGLCNGQDDDCNVGGDCKVGDSGTVKLVASKSTVHGDCTNEGLLAWDQSSVKITGGYTGTKTSKQAANACTIDIGKDMVMDGLCNGQDDDCNVGGDCKVGDSGTVKLADSNCTVDGDCTNAGELDWDHSSFKCTGRYTGINGSSLVIDNSTATVGKGIVSKDSNFIIMDGTLLVGNDTNVTGGSILNKGFLAFVKASFDKCYINSTGQCIIQGVSNFQNCLLTAYTLTALDTAVFHECEEIISIACEFSKDLVETKSTIKITGAQVKVAGDVKSTDCTWSLDDSRFTIANTFSLRKTTCLFGAGLVENVSDVELLDSVMKAKGTAVAPVRFSATTMNMTNSNAEWQAFCFVSVGDLAAKNSSLQVGPHSTAEVGEVRLAGGAVQLYGDFLVHDIAAGDSVAFELQPAARMRTSRLLSLENSSSLHVAPNASVDVGELRANISTINNDGIVTANNMTCNNSAFNNGGTVTASNLSTSYCVGSVSKGSSIGLGDIVDSRHDIWRCDGVIGAPQVTGIGTRFFGFGTVSADNFILLDKATASSSLTVNANVSLLAGGALMGEVTVIGNVLNDGVVSPGGNGTAGVITIDGNYTQTASGVLNILIGGTIPGTDFSQLKVSGTAKLDGTLDVFLLGQLSGAGKFAVVVSGQIDGTFSLVDLPLNSQLFYTHTEVDVGLF